MDDVTILTRYIAAWGWHISALLFLLSNINFIINKVSISWVIAFSILVFVCEFMAIKRQGEIE